MRGRGFGGWGLICDVRVGVVEVRLRWSCRSDRWSMSIAIPVDRAVLAC